MKNKIRYSSWQDTNRIRIKSGELRRQTESWRDTIQIQIQHEERNQIQFMQRHEHNTNQTWYATRPYSVRDRARTKHESNMKNRIRYSSCITTNHIMKQIWQNEIRTSSWINTNRTRIKYEERNTIQFMYNHESNMKIIANDNIRIQFVWKHEHNMNQIRI